MAGVKIIVDAGPLVGFLDRADQWHDWSLARFNELPSPFLTCEAVISEATYLLGQRGDTRLFEMLESGVLEIIPLLPQETRRLKQLMADYSARMQFADACLVRLSELNPDAQILTTDSRDFRIYRRNGKERLPLIVP